MRKHQMYWTGTGYSRFNPGGSRTPLYDTVEHVLAVPEVEQQYQSFRIDTRLYSGRPGSVTPGSQIDHRFFEEVLERMTSWVEWLVSDEMKRRPLTGLRREEVRQAAQQGVWTAWNKYDPQAGSQFPTYAVAVARNSIRSAMTSADRARHRQQLVFDQIAATRDENVRTTPALDDDVWFDLEWLFDTLRNERHGDLLLRSHFIGESLGQTDRKRLERLIDRVRAKHCA
jgi:hypothetical protein